MNETDQRIAIAQPTAKDAEARIQSALRDFEVAVQGLEQLRIKPRVTATELNSTQQLVLNLRVQICRLFVEAEDRAKEANADLERVQKACCSAVQFDAQKFAEDWYKVSEIEHFQSRQKSHHAEEQGRIPVDIYSKEFAVWLTEQYRLAMMRGMQVIKDAFRCP